MHLYLAQGYLICNANVDFYIKYSNLLSFELLKYSKGADLCSSNSILFWKPFQKILGFPVHGFNTGHIQALSLEFMSLLIAVTRRNIEKRAFIASIRVQRK